MTLADQIIEHGPYQPNDGVWPFVARVRTMAAADLNALRDELIAARKTAERGKRFAVLAVPGEDDDDQLLISCSHCPWIVVVLDDTATLAELNQRADEHTEECR